MKALRRLVGGCLRMGRLRTAMLAAAMLAVGSASIAVATSIAAGQVMGTRLVPGLLPGLARATRLSATPGSKRLEVGVGIARPDTAGEVRLFNELYDPRSPEYHHFLTVAQFNRRFGVRPATTAAVRDWLTAGGLRVTTGSAGGDYFTATGTVSQLEHLFKLRIADYSYKGTRFVANNVAPSVPRNLPISAVAGLNTLSHFTLDALSGRQLARAHSVETAIAAGRRVVARGAGSSTSGGAASSARGAASKPQVGPQSGDEQVYTPQDLWGIYDDPGASVLTESSGISDPSTLERSRVTLGQAQKIGVFGEGETSSVVRQLRLFETALGLPKVPVRTIETEGGPDSAYGDNSGSIEWYLDSQASTGMAPDVRQLDFYFAKSLSDADVAQEFDYWANDPNGPREMNASFGECEQNPSEPITGPLGNLPAGVGLGGDAEVLSDPALRQAALEGRTLFTSAGDTGSGCPEVYAPVLGGGNGVAVQPIPFQNYPCVSDYAVCVGGTVVSSPGDSYPDSAKRTAETSWTYSGGGSSYFNPAPDYQQGITALDKDCVSNDTGTTVYNPVTNPAPLCRGVPDVADLSGNITGDGYFIYIDGEPSSEGGTSLSSPLMMGQWARIQAAASSSVQSSGGLGFANGTIYQQAKGADTCTTAPCADKTYERDFFDITESEYGAGNGAYQPGPGWDYASGWGALNVANFAADVDGTTDAARAYTGSERAAADVCTATMTSPTGNATDPITDEGNDPGIDLTQATLSSSGKTVKATLTVPELSSGPPAESTSGASFYVAWEYKGIVYYAVAGESEGGADWSYSSGNTGPAMTDGAPNYGEYTNTTDSAATGSANTTTGVITINVPASEVGSPASGALLTDPQAFVQIEVGAPEVVTATSLTADSADTLRNYSVDDGEMDSIGVNVVMDGVAGSTCSDTLPATSVPTTTKPTTGTTTTKLGGRPVVCSEVHRFITHIRTKKLTRRELRLTGIAMARCPHYIVRDSIAIARVVKGKCSFLRASRRFTAFAGCRPRDYLKAKGTERWRFLLRMRLPKGVYHLWEHAVNNVHQATHNTARKHVWFRIK